MQSAGRAARGNWVAVYGEDGKEYGFVYGPATRRLIDGRLQRDLTGRVFAAAACDYVIRFIGRQSVPREFLDTADYDVEFTCRQGDVTAAFSAFMFITEIDYRLSSNQRYQISLDLPQIAGGYDKILSVTALYRRRDDLVAFHGVTLKGFAASPSVTEIPAVSVESSLKAAVSMAAASWTDRTWNILMGRAQEPGPTLDQIAPGRDSKGSK